MIFKIALRLAQNLFSTLQHLAPLQGQKLILHAQAVCPEKALIHPTRGKF
jgi:hypothetical protein